MKLASYLDLTDLNSLSSACRSIRDALVQFAYQLKEHSLRCTNEVKEPTSEQEQDGGDAMLALQMAFQDELNMGAGPALSFPAYDSAYPPGSSIGLRGRTSRCARDMVGPCRRCGTIVCRNCAEKPLSNKYLPGRLRRLCDACVAAPLALHKMPLYEDVEHNMPSSSASSTRSGRSESSATTDSETEHSYTVEVVEELPSMWLRDPCRCASRGVYLCHDCGYNVRSKDELHQRVWIWRSRYSTRLGGGLGIGLGVGNQGQKCGREKYCLATRDVMALEETECSEEVSAPGMREMSRAGTPLADDKARHDPGYLRQEIEGIGGKLKAKAKRLVKVGAIVYEYRDERESGRYLGREANGQVRSWCSWCFRVCPAEHELC